MAGITHAMKIFKINKVTLSSLLNMNLNNLKKIHGTFGLKDFLCFKNSNILFKSSVSLGSLALGAAYYQCYCKKNVLFDCNILEGFIKALQELGLKYANCEVKKNRRTDHYEKTVLIKELKDEKSTKKNLAFDWHLFWQIIYKEKFYFIAAIAVSFNFIEFLFTFLMKNFKKFS